MQDSDFNVVRHSRSDFNGTWKKKHEKLPPGGIIVLDNIYDPTLKEILLSGNNLKLISKKSGISVYQLSNLNCTYTTPGLYLSYIICNTKVCMYFKYLTSFFGSICFFESHSKNLNKKKKKLKVPTLNAESKTV